MRLTYHLVTVDRWAAGDPAAPYAAASLEAEGFIHCTDGPDELMATANRHYRDDPATYVALTVDLDRAGSRWSVEDERGIYPHVFGPIDRAAITAVQRIRRDADGRFVELGGAP